MVHLEACGKLVRPHVTTVVDAEWSADAQRGALVLTLSPSAHEQVVLSRQYSTDEKDTMLMDDI